MLDDRLTIAPPALLLDLADCRVGQVNVAGVCHGDVEPVGGQPGGDNPPHASRPASHQGSAYAVSRLITCTHESSPLCGRSSAR